MIEALPIKLVPLQWNLYWSHKELRINTTPALNRKKKLPKWIRIWLKTHLFQLRPLIVLYSLKCPVLEKCYQSFQNQPDRENHTQSLRWKQQQSIQLKQATSHKHRITLCLVPWYLFPGLPNPTINQGVYSTLAPLLLSGNEARMQSLVGTEFFLRKCGQLGLLG